MPLLGCGREFESPLRCQDEDRPVETWSTQCSLRHGVVIFHIEHRFDGHYALSVLSEDHSENDLRFRPLFPIKAVPEVGCLLLHITARSYGASQTQRLWRTPLLVTFCEISSTLLLGSQSALSVTPKDFLLLTYLYIHSPTMVCAMESTTEVWCMDTASELCFAWVR
jgi:hypothetical protein